jgi:peptidoglycan hydrolase-like protein with peptidoglycan-binding domain
VATTTTSTPPPDAQVPTGADDQAEFFRTLAFSGEMILSSEGTAVKAIQWALTEAGIPTAIDGRFGPRTEAAVKQFQTAKSLGVDGRVGPKTWAALGLPSAG